MKNVFKKIAILLIITCSFSAVSCNAIIPATENSEAQFPSISMEDFSEIEISDYNTEYYKMTVDDIYIKNDLKTANGAIKSDYHVIKKDNAIAATVKQAPLARFDGLDLFFVGTNYAENRLSLRIPYFARDEYEDADGLYYHEFRNGTNEYLGYMLRKEHNDIFILNSIEEFKNIADTAVSEFIDIKKFDVTVEDLSYNSEKPIKYRFTYNRMLNGIETTEKAICIVNASGEVVVCNVQNIGMFENVKAPKIDMKQLEDLALKKTDIWFEDLTEAFIFTDMHIENCIYDVYNGNIELHFNLAFHYYSKLVEAMKDNPLYDTIPMVIVFD